MPRYHFHLENSDNLIGDADGRELPDETAALREAGRAAGEVLMDELGLGYPQSRIIVTIAHSDGTRIAIVKAHGEVEMLTA